MKLLNNLPRGKAGRTIVAIFLIWRILLFLPLFLSENFIAVRQGFSFALPLGFINASKIISNFLIYPWGNFDGIYYLTIVQSAYTVDSSGFFPLFPILIKSGSSIFGNLKAFDSRLYLTALLLVSVFFLLSLFVLYKLLKLDYKNNIAVWSIVFMLIFPTSFFFASIYSESLFLLLLVLCFYFARRRNWILASIFGILLTATRLVGIAILPALLFEFYIQNKTLFSRKILSVLLIPLGILSFAYFNLVNFGNALQFIKAQGALLNNRSVDKIVLFPQTIFRYFKILTTVSFSQFEWWIALLELSSFVFTSILLYFAWKKKVRLSYILFSLIAFLIPASTGTFSGLPRYILVLFPIYIAISLIKDKRIKIFYSVISIILLFLLLMFFSKGYFIS